MATLTQQSPGLYRVQGELSFATVTDLLLQGHRLFVAEPTVDIDLSGVTHADSAGLSLLVEWLRQAKRHKRQLRYLSLPTQLQALANVSDIDGLFRHSA